MIQLRELREINSLVVRELNCELFDMNGSQFEGLLNELGNYDPDYNLLLGCKLVTSYADL